MRRALLLALAVLALPLQAADLQAFLRQLHRRLEAVAHERHRRAQPEERQRYLGP
jgi:ABC-type sulfate transport system permease component